ncbi:hypothetical protein ACFSC3_16895 [Sphingomonas floccifaciens]|uniref:Transposase n=1 Tax=Sphingomonas floccifaciens TaxID=1844115 RepID=A0ABW4NIR4_9SPHN
MATPLAAYECLNRVDLAFEEMGGIERTVSILDWLKAFLLVLPSRPQQACFYYLHRENRLTAQHD